MVGSSVTDREATHARENSVSHGLVSGNSVRATDSVDTGAQIRVQREEAGSSRGTAEVTPSGRVRLGRSEVLFIGDGLSRYQLRSNQWPGSGLVSLASIGPTREVPICEASVLCQNKDANQTQVYGLPTAVEVDTHASASTVFKNGFLLTVGLIVFLTHFYEAFVVSVQCDTVTVSMFNMFSMKIQPVSVQSPRGRKIVPQLRCPQAMLAMETSEKAWTVTQSRSAHRVDGGARGPLPFPSTASRSDTETGTDPVPKHQLELY